MVEKKTPPKAIRTLLLHIRLLHQRAVDRSHWLASLPQWILVQWLLWPCLSVLFLAEGEPLQRRMLKLNEFRVVLRKNRFWSVMVLFAGFNLV